MTERPTLYMLVGLPGSGKSTLCEKRVQDFGGKIVSSDAIRAELYGDAQIQGNPDEVFWKMRTKAVEWLNKGNDVYYDATNMTRKDRSEMLKICPAECIKTCIVVWEPIEVCIARAGAREERPVGTDVIDRMVRRFQFPYYDEGFDIITIKRCDGFDINKYAYGIEKDMNIPHDNPHHKLNILAHCKSAAELAASKVYDWSIYRALLYHDCGKPYTKSFTGTHGNPTEIAHYYAHQNVSAWIACGLYHDVLALWLISNHMEPFFNTKYYQKLPEYLKDSIDKLHECDLGADDFNWW